ncbi:MAG: hypothetical protein A2900_00200 [Candidatus Chisholmbacteria bacterium RIFCSPLOWO2_01_FULL_50_28]|uniref:CAAX prenyl protease 2/Lysostaphin resistance protein A-like domain-containing protein n=1 Tax=Candidatus Chisholmbacteria bacterium RIFCSPHIGHO2_01_FULL_52_32 TaxID=1797591 RepID=A0A1G1VQW4_9BACT|nr:MAG: hypothetical protein A2786_00545 [Candidatus Chisholmbacteria bacterium RIFCSPHIGHO2_01_FULL_52_32]OGY19525.1 MAG: hypothetical protein A2900_00200 [Candidatus Chisholmbacteria bacterium RIFCSPLOWO2_01_FULL_50_28]
MRSHTLFRRLILSVSERVGLVRPESRIEVLRRTISVYAVIFVLWGLYRLLFRFPTIIEELIFKPLVFLPPVLSVLVGEGKRGRALFEAFGFRRERLSLSIYFGLTLGVVYLLAVRLAGYVPSGERLGILPFTSVSWLSLLGVSLMTAVWEQMVFSGFFLSRFYHSFGNEWESVGLTAFLYTLLHFPILWFESHASASFIVIQLILFFFVGMGNAILMLRTRNLVAPILSHTFWSVAVGLFS